MRVAISIPLSLEGHAERLGDVAAPDPASEDAERLAVDLAVEVTQALGELAATLAERYGVVLRITGKVLNTDFTLNGGAS